MRVFGIALSLLLNLVVARLIGVEEYANYIYVFNWLSLLLLFSVLGFDTSVLKFVPLYNERKDSNLMRGIAARSQQIVFGTGCLIALAGIGLLQVLDLDVGLYRTFVAGLVGLPLFSLFHLRCSLLQAAEVVEFSQLLYHIIRPALFLVGFSGFIFLIDSAPNSVETMCVWLPVLMLLSLFASIVFQSQLPATTPEPQFRTQLWIGESLHLTLISGLQFLLAKTDVIMLGILSETRYAGIYAVASQIATLTSLGHATSSAVLSPRFTALHAADRHEEIQHLLNRAARVNAAVAIPVASCMVIFGTPLLGMYGSEFIEGYSSLALLALSQLVASLIGPAGLIMTLTGHHKQATLIILASALLNIGLNFLCIPLLGMLGGALATTACTVMRSVLLSSYVYTHIGVRTVRNPFRSFLTTHRPNSD